MRVAVDDVDGEVGDAMLYSMFPGSGQVLVDKKQK